MSPPTTTIPRSIASCAHPVSSAAKLFVQLAPPPPPSSSSSSRCASRRPVLDFLWPRAGAGAAARGPVARRTFRSSSGSSSGGSSNSSRNPASRPARIQTAASLTTSSAATTTTRRISSTTTTTTTPRPTTTTTRALFLGYPLARRFTQAVFNPQNDEDGNEMKLEITPRAAKRLSEIMRKDANPHLALRIQVESGGCHGFQYLMSLVTLPDSLPSSSSSSSSSSPSTSTPGAETETAAAPPSEHPGEGADSGAIREDDTIFTYTPEEAREQATASRSGAGAGVAGAPKIILDQPSLELLKGSKVDFTMELIGSQFKIVDNPLATSSCGCGTSFDIKI